MYPAPPVTRMMPAMPSCYASVRVAEKKPGLQDPVDCLQCVELGGGLGTLLGLCFLACAGRFGWFGGLRFPGGFRDLGGLGRLRGLRRFLPLCSLGLALFHGSGFRPVQQLDKRHRRVIANAKSKFQNAQISAWPRAVTGAKLFEKLGDDIAVTQPI